MNGTNYEVPHCGAFSTPHSHPSWAQIFALDLSIKILKVFLPSLIVTKYLANVNLLDLVTLTILQTI